MAQVYELSHFDFWRKIASMFISNPSIVDCIALKRHELKLTVFAFVFCIYAVRIYRAMKVRCIICLCYRRRETLWQIIGNSKFSLTAYFNFLSPTDATKIKYSTYPLIRTNFWPWRLEHNQTKIFCFVVGIFKLQHLQAVVKAAKRQI